MTDPSESVSKGGKDVSGTPRRPGVLVVAYYYPPVVSGGSRRPESFVRGLGARGFRTAALTQTPGATDLRSVPLRVHDPTFNLYRQGSRLLRWALWRGAVEVLNRLGSPVSILSPWKSRVCRRIGGIRAAFAADIVLASYPPAETLEIGLEMARQWHVPLVADFRDGLIFDPIEHQRLARFGCVRRHYEQLEREVAAGARLILAAHPGLADYLREVAGSSRVVFHPNAFDRAEILSVNAKQMGADTFDIVHAGGFAASDPACDISPFVDVVEERMHEGGDPVYEVNKPFILHM